MPYSLLLDLIAIEQVKHEGAQLKEIISEEDDFWRMMGA